MSNDDVRPGFLEQKCVQSTSTIVTALKRLRAARSKYRIRDVPTVDNLNVGRRLVLEEPRRSATWMDERSKVSRCASM